MLKWIAVASSSELLDGDLLGIAHGLEDILLTRISGEIFAVGNICTHGYTQLDAGFLISTTFEVECPLHLGRFDLRTGKPTMVPCEIPLPKYESREVNGQIEILLESS